VNESSYPLDEMMGFFIQGKAVPSFMKDENGENGGFRAGPSTVEGRCGTGEMKVEFSILVTDRNGRVRDFLQRELCEEGYRVHTVRDGRELLRMLDEETRLDLLVLDVEIPYADGSAILGQIRRKRSDLAVIIHTMCWILRAPSRKAFLPWPWWKRARIRPA